MDGFGHASGVLVHARLIGLGHVLPPYAEGVSTVLVSVPATAFVVDPSLPTQGTSHDQPETAQSTGQG